MISIIINGYKITPLLNTLDFCKDNVIKYEISKIQYNEFCKYFEKNKFFYDNINYLVIYDKYNKFNGACENLNGFLKVFEKRKENGDSIVMELNFRKFNV